jgi:hypothetical protein
LKLPPRRGRVDAHVDELRIAVATAGLALDCDEQLLDAAGGGLRPRSSGRHFMHGR